MKILSIVNQKGGVGKSTLAVNLAIAAIKDKKRTLLIDADTQGSSIAFRAIREQDDLQAIAITTPTIHKDIKKFKESYDFVIIDAGGRNHDTYRSAIIASEGGLLLIPLLPSVYDIWATEDTFKTLEQIKMMININVYTVFNQVMSNTIIAKDAFEALEEIAKENNIKMLQNCISNRQDFKKSISEGQGVIEYAPSGKASIEIKNLYKEIAEKF